MRFRALCGCLLAILASKVLVAAAMQHMTVLDGVYSEAQATRGADAYDAHCASCHEGVEPDAPPPSGTAFVDRWREAPLSFLFTHIRTNMPGNAPGSLSEATYLDLLAYLLSENHYPAGGTALTTAQLASITFVGANGPQPLPPNALVRVVGCLGQPSSDAWTLMSASDPARVRVADATTADELAQSAAASVGSAVYRLRNTSERSPGSLKGQRVQVKGVLTIQGGTASINVLSLASAGAGC